MLQTPTGILSDIDISRVRVYAINGTRECWQINIFTGYDVNSLQEITRFSRLCLNPEKTQLIWLGIRQQLEKLAAGDVQLLSASIRPQSLVRDPGVTLRHSADDGWSCHDSRLSVTLVISRCTNYDRQTSHWRRQSLKCLSTLSPAAVGLITATHCFTELQTVS